MSRIRISTFRAFKRTLSEWIDQVIRFFVSRGVVTLLVAMIFKTLPDVRLAWRNVLTGAVMTALLFNLGKLLFGQYLIRIDVTSGYGAASSLVIALLSIYYKAQVLLFGAKSLRSAQI